MEAVRGTDRAFPFEIAMRFRVLCYDGDLFLQRSSFGISGGA